MAKRITDLSANNISLTASEAAAQLMAFSQGGGVRGKLREAAIMAANVLNASDINLYSISGRDKPLADNNGQISLFEIQEDKS